MTSEHSHTLGGVFGRLVIKRVTFGFPMMDGVDGLGLGHGFVAKFGEETDDAGADINTSNVHFVALTNRSIAKAISGALYRQMTAELSSMDWTFPLATMPPTLALRISGTCQ